MSADIDTIRKFAVHNRNLDRSCFREGAVVCYRFNEIYYAFGQDKDSLVAMFGQWSHGVAPIDKFLGDCDGEEYIRFHHGFSDAMDKVLPVSVIDSEEVFYGMLQKKPHGGPAGSAHATGYSGYSGTTDRMFEFTDKAPESIRERRIPITGPGASGVRFDDKVNLGTLEVVSAHDPAYPGYPHPTFTELVKAGVCREWLPYRKAALYDIDENPAYFRNGKPLLRPIKAFFKGHGFDVSTDAIMHNFRAWRGDLKSGYRDEKNNCHVFSACGCNGFGLTVTELCGLCDWQDTYEC